MKPMILYNTYFLTIIDRELGWNNGGQVIETLPSSEMHSTKMFCGHVVRRKDAISLWNGKGIPPTTFN
jgi:hypothetical protein